MKYSLFIFFLLHTFIANAQVVINEICATNADLIKDEQYLNFSSWIELYNAGISPANIGGYFLSDDSNDISKWAIPSETSIPAKGYLLIWCDGKNTGLHTNFSLRTKGEKIILSTPSRQHADTLTYPNQYTNISFGRITNAAVAKVYITKPSPMGANSGTNATVVLDNPQVSLKAGRYSGTQQVTISSTQSGASIRYTVDGSEPKTTSNLYTRSISIAQTQTLKAKAYHPNFIPSGTEVKTYFINEPPFTLPVVSLSTTPSYLWDNQFGIYTDGQNGAWGNCVSSPKNWNQDWDRHASFEFFSITGEKGFDEECDIAIFGGCSRGNPQKSFALKARNKYGDNIFHRQLFKEKAIDEFGGFILRNSGNDFNVTMFRDALMQQLIREQMDIDYQSYTPAVLYLNGQYWGIQNMREKTDADYLESNYGLKKDQIDLLEGSGNAIEGSNATYTNYINQLQQIDRSTQQAYDYIDSQIDVQEFINYTVAQIYFANTDWPGNNIKYWREKSSTGKFRWLLFDTDFGFALYTGASYATHPTLDFATDTNGPGWPNPPWSTLHLRLLLDNPTFKEQFLQTFLTAIHTTFSPSRVHQFIDSLQQQIEPEIIRHRQRWGGDLAGWNWEVQRLRNFATERNNFMKQYVLDFFNISEEVNLKVEMNLSGAGEFEINSIQTKAKVNSINLAKWLPWRVSITPFEGYHFNNWDITERPSSTLNLIVAGDNWRYNDTGVFPGSNWNEIIYDDSNWSNGNAQLGYGDGDEQTILSYGADQNNKHITYYFRKKIIIDEWSDLAENLNAATILDDGARVYVNGVEVYNNNLPQGAIDNSTLALQATPTENIFQNYLINRNNFIVGENIIAVEIHQNSITSSDISFDFKLQSNVIGDEINYQSTEKYLSGITSGNIQLVASFEKLPEISGVVINELSANKSLVDEKGERSDWIELYNTTAQDIDLNGLYFTDALQNPTKHKIGGTTADPIILKAQDYLVFFADEDTKDGPLHLNFKISAEGEELGLFQMIGENPKLIDQYEFGYQPEGFSFSRIPNGVGEFFLTKTLTPRTENILTEGSVTPILFPNPAINTFQIISIVPVVKVILMDPIGRHVRTFENQITNQKLSLNGLRDGIFLARITTEDGIVTTVKLIKNN